MESLALVAAISMLALGCTGTEEVNCTDNPNERACIEACSADPTLSHCSSTADAGADADPTDGGTDAGPCGECGAETPLCNTDRMECVACLTEADCTEGDATMCSPTETCVQCLEDVHCEDPGASVCSTEGASAGSCVACAVGSATDCAGIVDGGTALNVCDDSGDAPACVECNSDDTCTDAACDLRRDSATRLTCVSDRPDTLFVCSECISNSECPMDQVCVPTSFMSNDTGYRCQWEVDSEAEEAMAFCANSQAPFVSATAMGPTAGAMEAQSCRLARTSCEGWLAFRGGGRGGIHCGADTDCGAEGVEDATCGVGGTMFCTMSCGGVADCVDQSGTAYLCINGTCTFIEL